MTIRTLLRGLPVLAHEMPSFDPAGARRDRLALRHQLRQREGSPPRRQPADRPSRIASLAGRQSDVLSDHAELDRELDRVRERLAAGPGLIAETHTVYTVTPHTVEFWQADRQRRHVRLRYRRTGREWERELLWP